MHGRKISTAPRPLPHATLTNSAVHHPAHWTITPAPAVPTLNTNSRVSPIPFAWWWVVWFANYPSLHFLSWITVFPKALNWFSDRLVVVFLALVQNTGPHGLPRWILVRVRNIPNASFRTGRRSAGKHQRNCQLQLKKRWRVQGAACI